MWVYLTICLFFIGIKSDFYIESLPIIDNSGKCYQLYSFIPLCVFTNYFNYIKYIQN